MTTPRTRALVSFVARMAVTLALGACAASRPTLDGPIPVNVGPPAIRFDNDGREHVYVYLINERREWLLGRVEPMAVAMLRIPETALAERSVFMQIAVVAGERPTLRAAHDPRARITIAQPASAILSQQWMFSQGQITALRLRSAGMNVATPQ